MNLAFLYLWDFILFVQYKSKQNQLKVLSYTDFVFNAYIIIYASSVFLGTPGIVQKTSNSSPTAGRQHCTKRDLTSTIWFLVFAQIASTSISLLYKKKIDQFIG